MRTSTLILLLGLVIAVSAQESCDVHKHQPDRVTSSFDRADPNECKEDGPANDDPASPEDEPQNDPEDDPQPQPNPQPNPQPRPSPQDPKPRPSPQDPKPHNPTPNNGGDVSGCRDNHQQCKMMDMLCKDETYIPMMVGVCAKTCNLCEAWKNGPESSARCKNMSYTCARKSLDCNSQMNKIMCPFTCKTCT